MSVVFQDEGTQRRCQKCSEWQLVERFDGGGGENVIFICHFCGHLWKTTKTALGAEKENKS